MRDVISEVRHRHGTRIKEEARLLEALERFQSAVASGPLTEDLPVVRLTREGEIESHCLTVQGGTRFCAGI